MSENETLGRYIRRSRIERGMSLGQLADKVGRSSSSVRRWERDEVAPALTVVPSLAEVLGVDEDELVSRRGTDLEPEDVSESEDPTHPTMEQPVIPPIIPAEAPRDDASNLGLFGDFWASLTEGRSSWIGWVRGGATAVVLIVMLLVFIWAFGELLAALGQVWDSLDTG
ncbi:MAG: helix-turn-helix transcriptional regulator [Acidimicrobiia bacterium]|nr:helix-turn-helix transcriptional regulator [Acidimicrobiia bacterium]